ncbi:hypothetical protein CCA_00635 [Chlamydia caviae GPIC]|uniref:Uncharacterized protein n=1 Tax=Chlamydia caviae (strain ATCC VR-813 / DSM 19441 / 03DC25 / GPIC) TaxID=227941 RepID=Q822P4_CHLCV|nr:hypothetical protein CCA_00635 [Chlamydia caviae GPIC]
METKKIREFLIASKIKNNRQNQSISELFIS